MRGGAAHHRAGRARAGASRTSARRTTSAGRFATDDAITSSSYGARPLTPIRSVAPPATPRRRSSGPPCSIALTIRLSSACPTRAGSASSSRPTVLAPSSEIEPPLSSAAARQRQAASSTRVPQTAPGRRRLPAVDLAVETARAPPPPARARPPARLATWRLAARPGRGERQDLERPPQLVHRRVERAAPAHLAHPPRRGGDRQRRRDRPALEQRLWLGDHPSISR